MNIKKTGILAVIVAIAGFLWLWSSGGEQSDIPASTDASPATESGPATAERRNAQTGNNQAGSGSSESGKPQAGNAQANGQAGSGRPAAGQGGARPGGRSGGGRPPALVVARPVSEALINDRLKAVGSGRAVASVSVVPLSSGLLTEILVSSGQRVAAGDVLARLDDDEQRIALDRAARTAEDAAIDEARLAQLYRSRTTTEVELNNARADLADAQLALREAELTLARRAIAAPISGVIGLVAVDKGNYVTPQNVLVTIDDRSTLILDFWIPERFANQIELGQSMEATALANPAISHKGEISGIGSRIETDSRTLPVQARVDNTTDNLRPGMSFDVQLNFTGETFPAVDPLAVQWNSSGSYVWQIVEDKVKRVPVRIIQRNPDAVLVQAELAADDSIVVEGLMSLRPGAQVRVQGAGRAGGRGQNGAGGAPRAAQPGTAQNGQTGEEQTAQPRRAENAGGSEPRRSAN